MNELVLAALWWKMVLKDSVYGLSNGEEEKKDGGKEGKESPWTSKIGVYEVSPPHVPALLAVLMHHLMDFVEGTLWVQGHVLG